MTLMVKRMPLGLVAAVCAFVLLMSSPAWPAKRPQPPSQDIQSTPSHRLVIGQATAVDGNTVEFKVLDRLSGEPGLAQLSLVLDRATAGLVGLDERYLLAYSDAVKTRFPAQGYQQTEPHLIRNLVAGEIICGSSPTAIAMLDGSLARRHAGNQSAHLEALLSALEARDPFLARLAGAELVGRPTLLLELNDSQIERILGVLGHHDADPAVRTIALMLAQQAALPAEQLRPHIEHLLGDTPVTVVSSHAYWPGLIRSALLAWPGDTEPANKQILEKWLSAEHRGVVEAALRVIGAMQPEMELTIVYRVLKQPFLAQAARQVLQQRVQVLSKR